MIQNHCLHLPNCYSVFNPLQCSALHCSTESIWVEVNNHFLSASCLVASDSQFYWLHCSISLILWLLLLLLLTLPFISFWDVTSYWSLPGRNLSSPWHIRFWHSLIEKEKKNVCVCVCVCVEKEREREREREGEIFPRLPLLEFLNC